MASKDCDNPMKAELRSGRHAAPVVYVPYLQLDPLFSVRGLCISVPKSHVVNRNGYRDGVLDANTTFKDPFLRSRRLCLSRYRAGVLPNPNF